MKCVIPIRAPEVSASEGWPCLICCIGTLAFIVGISGTGWIAAIVALIGLFLILASVAV